LYLSPSERDQLEEWLPHARHVAIATRVPLPIDDRIQEGVFGAAWAIAHYDPAGACSLKTWIGDKVRHSVIDAARRYNHTRYKRQLTLVHFDHRPGDEDDRPLDPGESDHADVVTDEIAFDQALAKVPNVGDRTVVELHLRDGLTLAEIGARLGYGESRACQRFRRGCRDLTNRLVG
jgi:RNA polymerase sigma factor (sigma-70 family)